MEKIKNVVAGVAFVGGLLVFMIQPQGAWYPLFGLICFVLVGIILANKK